MKAGKEQSEGCVAARTSRSASPPIRTSPLPQPAAAAAPHMTHRVAPKLENEDSAPVLVMLATEMMLGLE